MNRESKYISLKTIFIALLLLFTSVSTTIAKKAAEFNFNQQHKYDKFVCGTRSDHLLHSKADKLHALQKSRLNKIQFVPLATANFDVGDVAIIEDDGTLILPPSAANPFDLEGLTLQFTRNTSGGYDIATIPFAFDTPFGTMLDAGDDTNHEFNITSGFSFPFFGSTWTNIWVRSNGNVTFGGIGNPDFFDPSDFDLELPMIAAFFTDLDPSVTGGVFVKFSTTKFVVTWNKITEFEQTNSNTIQLTLRNTGSFTVTYNGVDIREPAGVSGTLIVGFNSGRSSPTVKDVDFSNEMPIDGSSFDVISELFRPINFLPQVNYIETVIRFYQTHNDIFDQVVMFTSFDSDLGDNAFAFHLGVSNAVQGINREIFDNSATWGSAGKLKSFLNMNTINIWNPDPAAQFFTDGSSFLAIMAQESGHKWLAFVSFFAGGGSSDLMLGRGLAHWSRFAFTESSSIEGNDWVELSPNSFENASVVNGFSNLDLYLMGYRSPEEVPDFFYIDSPSNNSIANRSAGTISKGGMATGTRTNVSVNDIITVESLRAPSRDFSQKDYHQGFILLVEQDSSATADEISKLQNFIDAWRDYWNVHTDGRGTLSTSLTTQLPVAVLEGIVRDISTNLIIRNMQAELVEKGIKQPVISGGYYTWRILADTLISPDELFTQVISAYPYFPDTSTITMVFGSSKTKNLSLTKLPTGSISGTITDALTDMPVETTVFLSVQSDQIDDFVLEINSDSLGNYLFENLFITQPGVIRYESITLEPGLSGVTVTITDIIVNEGNNVINIVLNAADIMLVNDDPAGNHLGFYLDALDSVGITYNEWRTLDKGPASTQSIDRFGFPVIIWYTGDAGLDAISPQEEDSLIQFLDGGGRLFITGQNVVESLSSTSRLLTDYFEVSHGGNSSEIIMSGVSGNPVTDGFSLFGIFGGDGASNQTSPDIFLPSGIASAAIKYGTTGEEISAVTIDNGTYKIFLAGFGLESIVDTGPTLTKRHQLLFGVLDWFEVSSSVEVEDESLAALPNQFVLEQNYPNPFNPETSINYSISHDAKVKITIFNILGQRVKTLVDNNLAAGKYTVSWNGSTVTGSTAASGVYFYRMEAVSSSQAGKKVFVDTKKMLFLK